MESRAADKTAGFNAKYFLLYLPALVSTVMAGDAVLSYFIAWGGSLLIL
jgi:hypothetical protein